VRCLIGEVRNAPVWKFTTCTFDACNDVVDGLDGFLGTGWANAVVEGGEHPRDESDDDVEGGRSERDIPAIQHRV
jgi:hypothetical protein